MISIKKIKIFFIFFIFFGCADYNSSINNKQKLFYTSNGFALIYEEKLYVDGVVKKKINNNESETIHSFLKKNTLIKITNPINANSVLVKVNKVTSYPKIFNIIISKKIANLLDLDLNNPYIEISEVKKNKTFIAKEGNIIDEEKNVAGKVPVDEIQIDDLSKSKNSSTKKIIKQNSYFLIINDFYYKNNADELKNNLIKKTNINNFIVKKITTNNYRLSVGPFINFNAIKSTYISLNNLGFDDLNIYKE